MNINLQCLRVDLNIQDLAKQVKPAGQGSKTAGFTRFASGKS